MKKIFYVNALLIIVFVFIQCKGVVTVPVDNEHIVEVGQKCKVEISIDTCGDTLIQKEYFHELMSRINLLDANCNSLGMKKASLERELADLYIDAFLNVQDTTIFGSKFLVVDETSLSARSRGFYKLIKNIRDLNDLLNKKSTPLESLKVPDKAFTIITTINTTNEETFSCLSESQVEYYRQLIQQYNDLVETLK